MAERLERQSVVAFFVSKISFFPDRLPNAFSRDWRDLNRIFDRIKGKPNDSTLFESKKGAIFLQFLYKNCGTELVVSENHLFGALFILKGGTTFRINKGGIATRGTQKQKAKLKI